MAGKQTVATTNVASFMAQLDHPRKAEIEAIRAIILGADPSIQESIKWNAPSFSIDEHFATLKLRPSTTVQVVFHTGAKVKPNATAMTIDDPLGLLKWAAPDRCVATFTSVEEIEARRGTLVSIVKQWIAQM